MSQWQYVAMTKQDITQTQHVEISKYCICMYAMFCIDTAHNIALSADAAKLYSCTYTQHIVCLLLLLLISCLLLLSQSSLFHQCYDQQSDYHKVKLATAQLLTQYYQSLLSTRLLLTCLYLSELLVLL
jgi:hypothetical protein